MQFKIIPVLAAFSALALLSACTKSSSTSTEDSSTSGSVASIVGGTYNNSDSGGTLTFRETPAQKNLFTKFAQFLPTLVPNALAASVCPTYASTGSACTVSGSTMKLSYGTGCSFSGSEATWEGEQDLSINSGTPACGTFPSRDFGGGGSGILTRTFTSGTERIAASGRVVQIDSLGSDAEAISGPPSGGMQATFSNSSTRTQIAIPGVNLIATTAAGTALFNHSISTSLSGGSPITLSGATVTGGTVITLHNLLKIQASSTFSNVTFSAGCCMPTSGTITTAFSAVSGVTPTRLGATFIGSSETLTFEGCGIATYSGPDGTVGSVTLGTCI